MEIRNANERLRAWWDSATWWERIEELFQPRWPEWVTFAFWLALTAILTPNAIRYCAWSNPIVRVVGGVGTAACLSAGVAPFLWWLLKAK